MVWKIQISETTKVCITCGVEKPLREFYVTSVDCKLCRTVRSTQSNLVKAAASERLGLGRGIGGGTKWMALRRAERACAIAFQRTLTGTGMALAPRAANDNVPAVPRPAATPTDYIESDAMAALKAENTRRIIVQEEKEGIFKRKDGSVYVMINEVFRRPVFKIGGAFDLRERLATFQTGAPADCPYEMLFSRHFPNQIRAEAAVHRALADMRVPGSREWYNGSYQDGIAMIREFAQRR
jgi:hypothetical protein